MEINAALITMPASKEPDGADEEADKLAAEVEGKVSVQ